MSKKILTEKTKEELYRKQQEIINGVIDEDATGELIDDSVSRFLELLLKGKTESDEFQNICAYTLKKLELDNII